MPRQLVVVVRNVSGRMAHVQGLGLDESATAKPMTIQHKKDNYDDDDDDDKDDKDDDDKDDDNDNPATVRAPLGDGGDNDVLGELIECGFID